MKVSALKRRHLPYRTRRASVIASMWRIHAAFDWKDEAERKACSVVQLCINYGYLLTGIERRENGRILFDYVYGGLEPTIRQHWRRV